MKVRVLSLFLIVTCGIGLTLPGCTKVLVYGKDRPADPLEKEFSAATKDVFDSAKKALEMLGYKIQEADEDKGHIRSGWRGTKPNSHYLDLFDRKDYGTTGSYYQVDVRIEEVSGKTNVAVSTPVRSLINHITSSYREERKILDRIGDLLRRDDFEMTNVGVKE